jgi:flagellar motor switch protein FliM
MTGQVLSADAVAALVDAAREGRLPEEAPPQQRRRRMRTVDFTRPSKFTPEQERRLRRGLEAFCRTASTRLSAELRAPLELEVLATTQMTWANAHGQLPESAIAGVVDIRPAGTRMLVCAEQELLVGAIELLLGGSSAAEARARRLTDIDWALGRHFLDRLLAQLSVIWTDLMGQELGLGALDTQLEMAQLSPVSEPTLSLTMEARLDGTSSALTLLLPWSAIEPVAERISARDDSAAGLDGREAASVRRAVGRVEMTVRAEVAAVELPIEAVLGLRPGDLLRLDAPAGQGVTLYADEVPVHRGRPGRSGGRRAVQVTERLEDPS